MADMNPENNRDTFQGRGHRIEELEKENSEMRHLLKLIWESDCLPHWTFEHCDDEEPIAEMVRKFVKESK